MGVDRKNLPIKRIEHDATRRFDAHSGQRRKVRFEGGISEFPQWSSGKSTEVSRQLAENRPNLYCFDSTKPCFLDYLLNLPPSSIANRSPGSKPRPEPTICSFVF
jgi:hypothetical protein